VKIRNKETMYITLILIIIGIALFSYQNSENTAGIGAPVNNINITGNNDITGKEII
jgi:hypothetical protein